MKQIKLWSIRIFFFEEAKMEYITQSKSSS